MLMKQATIPVAGEFPACATGSGVAGTAAGEAGSASPVDPGAGSNVSRGGVGGGESTGE